jgi:MipA family protein
MNQRLTCRACLHALPLLLLGALGAPVHAAGTPKDLAGAVTLSVQSGPDYLGSRDRGLSVRPGFFLRWGRLSVSSGGGWAARRQDVEVRGLGYDLAHTETFDATLGLRMDSGRSESDSAALAGMGDVRRTIRARIGADWRFAPGWQLSGAWTVDAFGRGGGNQGELRLRHEWPLAPTLTLSSGAVLTIGGDRYMQTYFGVTPEQAQRSGYAVYSPGLGLRDAQVYTSLRYELGPHWVLTGGPGLSRMLGPAACSPLTQKKQDWSMSVGAGYRF